jgi:hypothetical protein
MSGRSRPDCTTPLESMIGSTVTVPLPARLGGSKGDAERNQALPGHSGIEAPVTVGSDGLDVDVSAQIYCDRADIERLQQAVGTLPNA